MTAIVDYGVGNLFSLCQSLRYVGEEPVVTGDAAVLEQAGRILLPGVGAFGDAAARLRETGLGETLRRLAGEGKPLLGVCLGMQLLLERSFEYGEHEGLGLIPGSVVPIPVTDRKAYKIPQIGWNALSLRRHHPLWKDVRDGDHVYFVHSFHGQCAPEDVIAVTEHGTEVTAAIARGNVMGAQFHPEKSGKVGLAMLRAFCEIGQ